MQGQKHCTAGFPTSQQIAQAFAERQHMESQHLAYVSLFCIHTAVTASISDCARACKQESNQRANFDCSEELAHTTDRHHVYTYVSRVAAALLQQLSKHLQCKSSGRLTVNAFIILITVMIMARSDAHV
jgi:hypothetical protein